MGKIVDYEPRVQPYEGFDEAKRLKLSQQPPPLERTPEGKIDDIEQEALARLQELGLEYVRMAEEVEKRERALLDYLSNIHEITTDTSGKLSYLSVELKLQILVDNLEKAEAVLDKNGSERRKVRGHVLRARQRAIEEARAA